MSLSLRCWEPDLPEPVETSAAPAASPILFVIDDDEGLEVLDDPLDLPEVSEIINGCSKGESLDRCPYRTNSKEWRRAGRRARRKRRVRTRMTDFILYR